MLNAHIGMVYAALRDTKGIAAMEYAILAAAVLGAIGVGFTTLGGDLSTLISTMVTNANAIAHPTGG